MHFEDNANDEPASSIEYVPVDFRLRNLIQLAEFQNVERLLCLEHWIYVRYVYPCGRCAHPVVQVRLDSETRTVDAVETRSGWQANILAEHECMGPGQ